MSINFEQPLNPQPQGLLGEAVVVDLGSVDDATYISPAGVLEGSTASEVTLGGDGSSTDTERMSWKDRDDDDEGDSHS